MPDELVALDSYVEMIGFDLLKKLKSIDILDDDEKVVLTFIKHYSFNTRDIVFNTEENHRSDLKKLLNYDPDYKIFGFELTRNEILFQDKGNFNLSTLNQFL